MKTVIAVALLIAGISAAPKLDLKEADLGQPRIVTNAIESVIDDLRHLIRDNGFDPLDIEKDKIEFEHDIPSVYIEAFVEGLYVTGLSDIKINNLSFNVLSTRLSFDIELPKIDMNLKQGEADIEFLGTDHKVSGGGSGYIRSTRVSGTVRVNVSIISGISVRDLNMIFSVGEIKADVRNFEYQGEDETETLNNILNHLIPEALEEHSELINTTLEAIFLKILDQVL